MDVVSHSLTHARTPPTSCVMMVMSCRRVPVLSGWMQYLTHSRKVLDAERAAAGGAWPETVAVTLWGLNEIKTRGESVAIVLYLVGARYVHLCH